MGFIIVSLKNPSGTGPPSLQPTSSGNMSSDCLWFSDEAHFHLDWFVKKQNMKFRASGNPDL
jgi:hypothetical protein